MSSIPSAVANVLQARSDALGQKVQIACLAKQLDAQKQSGDAINAMLEQSKQLQSQLAQGHVDVKA
ncbi:hypothetical protein [Novipirellula artificiosorum]|uniref:Uncharacterized protein n=1 Tax=Novipirellula artificiosorum TaxID=2528016 RepID=A0A5C6E2D5_9BACT|nr:hypothetical protein [Novipirellula artificiosorum]TWU41771.1 hypothetical protein Poly41_00630 [Novipirellula artificiosorum]